MTSILGNCPSIQTVQYTPFLEPGNMTAWNIPYDVQRFGKPESTRPMLDGIPQVFRIMGYESQPRQIGTFPTYNITGLTKRKDEQVKQIELITGAKVDFWSLEEPDSGRGRKYKVLVS